MPTDNLKQRLIKIYTQNANDIPTKKFSVKTIAEANDALRKNQLEPGNHQALKMDVDCFDSSFRKQYHADKVAQYISFVLPAKNGDILISGAATNALYGFQKYFGYLIRMDKDGNIKWMKEYFNDNETWFDVYHLYETDNGEIIAVGDVAYKGNANVDSNYCTAVVKLTESGSVIWSTGFNSKLEKGTASCNYQSSVFINSINPGLNGDFILNGTSFGCPSPQYNTTLLIDKDGNLLWDANYTLSVAFHQGISAVLYKGNVLTVTKRDNIFSGGDNTINLIFQVLDYNTGKCISTKGFKESHPYPDFFYKEFGSWSVKMVKGDDNNFYVYGNMLNAYSPDGVHDDMFGVAVFDANLNYVNGYTIATDQIDLNGQTGYYGSEIQIQPSGLVTLGWLQSIAFEEKHLFLATIKNGQFIKSQEATYYNDMYGDSKLATVDDGSTVYVSAYQKQAKPYYKHWMVLKKNYQSDTSTNNCVGVDTSFAWIGDLKYTEYPSLYIDDSAFNKLYLVHTDFTLLQDSLIPENACDAASVCDTIKIHGKLDYCGSNPKAVFTAYKNEACGANILWSFDTSSVSTANYLNDTTLELTFKRNWSGSIYAETGGSACSLPIYDSVLVNVQTTTNKLNLGNDTILCKGDSLKLDAGSYKSYEWQDGSKDSIYTVKKPGNYSVTVTDFCGNVYSDTISITGAAVPDLSIGDDTLVCIGDTINLHASAGFKSYAWYPPTVNATGKNASEVINKNELIYANATTNDGCTTSDSISITTKYARPISLGSDTSFCDYDSIILNAGDGYALYQWNTGSITQNIAAHKPGNYVVIAKDINDCFASDSLQVISVYAHPAPDLGNDQNICDGSFVTLNAGNYFLYTWSDGSSSQYLKITQPGTYWVKVTDNNKCIGSDTFNVSQLLPPPSAFLPPVDSLCSYDKLTLMPSGSFATYKWSTGDMQPTIIIDKPGLYTLNVTDYNGCSGISTTNVVEKDCMNGVYIPTAFTPNNDGKNDVFRAMVFGKVLYFSFNIYDRFGELIFSTNDPSKGWNGLIKGRPQNIGSYVWQCAYQLEGNDAKFEKGTVILMH